MEMTSSSMHGGRGSGERLESQILESYAPHKEVPLPPVCQLLNGLCFVFFVCHQIFSFGYVESSL